MHLISGMILVLLAQVDKAWLQQAQQGSNYSQPTPCQLRPCHVSIWSPWSNCSDLCAQKRHRYKTLAESCGGACHFHLYEERACHGNCQPKCHQRPCHVSGWSSWSGCSDGCVQTRRRYKTMSESCGGGCHFNLYEERACHGNCQKNKENTGSSNTGLSTGGLVGVFFGVIALFGSASITIIVRKHYYQRQHSDTSHP